MSNYSTVVNETTACGADLLLGFKSRQARNGWLYQRLEATGVSALCVKIYRTLVRCCGARAYTLIHWDQVADSVGCSVRYVKIVVARLVALGFLRRVRQGNTWRTVITDLDPIDVDRSTDDGAPVCSEPSAPADQESIAPVAAGAFFAAPAGDRSIACRGSIDPALPFNDSGSTTAVSYEPAGRGGKTSAAGGARRPAARVDLHTPAVAAVLQFAAECGQLVHDVARLARVADQPLDLVQRAITRARAAASRSPVGLVLKILESGVVWDQRLAAPGRAAASGDPSRYVAGALADLIVADPDDPRWRYASAPPLPAWLHGGGDHG